MNYLTRTFNGTTVSECSKLYCINNSIKYIINNICLENLSTYEGRRKSISKIFGFKTLTPIFVNEELILFPTSSLRDYDMIFINSETILSVIKEGDNTKIIFKDLTELIVFKKYHKINILIKRTKIIKEYLNIE